MLSELEIWARTLERDVHAIYLAARSPRVRGSPLALIWRGSYRWVGTANSRTVERRSEMAWKTPKIVEVPVGMEINMYACAARK
jgi:coenzyme PQQ precursor peptide PqqA